MPLIDRLKTAIEIDTIKSWLKIEHDLDDAILSNLKEVAINEVFNFMQNDFEEENEMGELVLKPIPFNITLACLMYIAYIYENRGDNQTELPLNCMRLLRPFKRLVGL